VFLDGVRGLVFVDGVRGLVIVDGVRGDRGDIQYHIDYIYLKTITKTEQKNAIQTKNKTRILKTRILKTRILKTRIIKTRILKTRILKTRMLKTRILKTRILKTRILKTRILKTRMLKTRILNEKTRRHQSQRDISSRSPSDNNYSYIGRHPRLLTSTVNPPLSYLLLYSTDLEQCRFPCFTLEALLFKSIPLSNYFMRRREHKSATHCVVVP